MATGDKIDWGLLAIEYNEYMTCSKEPYMDAYKEFWSDRGGRDRYFTTDHAGDEVKREFLGPPANQRVLSDSPPEQTFGSPLPIQPYSVEISYASSGTVFVDATMSAFGLKQTLLHYTNLCEEECDQLIVSLDKFGRWEVAGGTGVPQPFILTLTVRK